MDILSQHCETLGFPLSQGQLAQFRDFRAALYEANQVMNLTRVPFEECENRHFVDCLLFLDLIPTGSKVLDLGTGPGFPAWPIACARPDCSVSALDSSGKMLGFLRRQALPNLELVAARAEDTELREDFDFVTGRAIAPLPIQLELSAAFCKNGGIVMPMRTSTEREMVASLDAGVLGLELEATIEREVPDADVIRLFPLYRKVRMTPDRFPRTWTEIKKRPIGG